MKTYIAGPMAGMPEFNRAGFLAAANILREELGWEAVSPWELDQADGKPHPGTDFGANTVTPDARAWYLRRDLRLLLDCEAIALLPGWRESRGANVELMVARSVGLEVFEFFEDPVNRWVDAFCYSQAAPDVALVALHVDEVMA